MQINIAEILVANGSGAVMVILLFLFRVKSKESKRAGEWLYNSMLVATLLALITETISFLIDGKQFSGCFALQYFTNFVCLSATAFVGYFWCLFVNFRIYRSVKRIKRKSIVLGLPFFGIIICMVVNLFWNGLMYGISNDNVYSRGLLCCSIYIVVFFYFVESIVAVYRSRPNEIFAEHFPVYYFVIPCMIGTLIQGVFYGLSIGWMAVSIAFVFVNIQLQAANSLIDDMSGLFNRKYLNYCLEKIQKAKKDDVYGIGLDANDFKKINDSYGHLVGDCAIHHIGKILSESVSENAVAIRIAGDEFIILVANGSQEDVCALKKMIDERVCRFNKTTNEPFRLSLSMGIAKCDNDGDVGKFLSDMDREMYAAKKAYYMNHERRRDSSKMNENEQFDDNGR